MTEHLRLQWRTSSSGIRGYLEQVSSMMDATYGQSQRKGWKFTSVEALVLHYGRSYTPGPLAEELCMGEMKMCYMNAMNAAMGRSDLTYVEGYADPGFFPTGHGWVTADGRTAMDPTWDDAKGYFGVPLKSSFWQAHVARTGYWGVFFPEMGDEHHAALLKDGLPSGALA